MGDNVDVTEEEQFFIKIERLHSRAYIASVYKTMSIEELKEKIAVVSGVASGLQHLLFRGRVLRDDHVLSDYQIERDHTVYLVVRSPVPQIATSDEASDFNLSGMGSQSSQSEEEIPDALTRVSSVLRRQTPPPSFMGNEEEYGRVIETFTHTRRELLVGEVAQTLSNISMLLGNRGDQSSSQRAVQPEIFLSNLGNTLIELGRTISRIAMGDGPVVLTVNNGLQIQIPSNGARNLPVASDPRNAVITRQIICTFHWPVRRRQPLAQVASSESQNAVDTSSPQPTTEEELENAESDSD